jgi:hypothetical protein
MTLPHMTQTEAVKLRQASAAKERVKLDRHSMTEAEAELWEHTVVNRLAELRAGMRPMLYEEQIAWEEADEAVLRDREARGAK